MHRALSTALVAALAMAAPALADEPKSEACKLLTAEEAAKITGHTVMNGDDSPETGGLSSCGWVDEETFAAIVLIVHGGDALGGMDATAVLDGTKSTATGATEDLSGVGEKAYLQNQGGEGDSLSLSLSFVKSGKMVSVNATGVPKEGVVEAATTIASRL